MRLLRRPEMFFRGTGFALSVESAMPGGSRRFRAVWTILFLPTPTSNLNARPSHREDILKVVTRRPHAASVATYDVLPWDWFLSLFV